MLIDFSAPLSEVILYVAVKLGIKSYENLNLVAYGTSEALRSDRSLQEQGIAPINRLFCLTLAKDEQPLFPQDAVDSGFVVSASAMGADSEANLLNVPEEMLTRATKRGHLEVLNEEKGKFSTRFFVLQDADLYRYREARDKRAKDVLHEPVAVAIEPKLKAPAKKTSTLRMLGKAEKFEFLVTAGNQKITLRCGSPEEGAAWIKAINQASHPEGGGSAVGVGGAAAAAGASAAPAVASASANSNNDKRAAGAIFRNTLSAAVSRTDGSEIPDVVVKTIEYLDKQSILKIVGLFRLSGSAPAIAKLAEDIDAGLEVDFSLVADPHTVSGLLKLYFREMAEPLLTWELYAPFTASCALTNDSVSDKIRYLRQVIDLLPPVNKATLAYLMKFLAKVASYSAYNKMPLHNIATVFAPNILREKDASMLQIVESSSLVNNAVITILQYHDYLLGGGAFPVKSEFPTRPIAKAHHAFDVTAPGDLALSEDATVSVLGQGADGWWYGESEGRYGRFPGSYVVMLDNKDADKARKKSKIEVKIQEMREQAEHQDKEIARLAEVKRSLQEEIDKLVKQTAHLQTSDFPPKVRAVAQSMPQFAATLEQYREALEQMLQQTELSASQQQELLIALNGLWSAANNPKLQKKYKKVLVKMEPQLAVVREALQKSIQRKRETMEVRSDLVKDLAEFSTIARGGGKSNK